MPWPTTSLTAWATTCLKAGLLLACLWLLAAPALAQRPSISCRFDRDTVQTGDLVTYWLKLRRPRGAQALLADSSFLPGTFHMKSRAVFRSQSDSIFSYDSVMFTLQCFAEPGPAVLQLPGFIFQGEDTLVLVPRADTLVVASVLTDADSTSLANLKQALVFVPVPPQFNYPFMSLAVGGALIALLLINQFLGRPLRMWVRLLLLYRRHRSFLLVFDRLESQTRREQSAQRMEAALRLWKMHMERLAGQPYTTYTTREIAAVIPDQNLLGTLQHIDRWVYGGVLESSPTAIFGILRRYALLFYQRRRQAIRNG